MKAKKDLMAVADGVIDAKLIQSIMDLFISERGWDEFRTPKNLAMALSVEASEIVELFQWRENEKGHEVRKNSVLMSSIRDELADVLSYLLQLAGILEIDLSKAFLEKHKKNKEKHYFE